MVLLGGNMKNSARYSYKLLTLLSSAGVSVAPAALLGAASVLLAPATAFANNECVPIGVDPALNGATADSYVCSGASTYAVTGIGYNTAGPLTLTSSGAMSVGPVGINLIGTGADTITYTSSSGVITGTGGPVFDVQTATGAINLTTTGITGTNIAVTYGIAAFSTSGAITIADSGTINVN